jgi:hypothetical protein
VSASPSQMTEVREYLNARFPEGANDNVRIVSFYYPTQQNLSDVSRLSFWRSALSFDEELSLMGDAYRRWDKLLSRLQEEHRAILWPYYHACATQLFEARALIYIHETTTCPHCLLVSGDCGDTRAYEGLALARKLFTNSPPTPALNPNSYERLLRQQLQEREVLISRFDQEAAAEEQRDAHEAVWRRGAKRPGSEDVLVVLDDAGPGHLLTAGLSVLKELGARGYPIQYPSEYLLAIEEGGGADVEAVEIQKVESEELHPVQPIVRDVGLEVSKSASPLGVLHDDFTINDGVVHGKLYAGIGNGLKLARPIEPTPGPHRRLSPFDVKLHPIAVELDFEDVPVGCGDVVVKGG